VSPANDQPVRAPAFRDLLQKRRARSAEAEAVEFEATQGKAEEGTTPMSLNGNQAGGSYFGKKPPQWQLELFAIFVFGPIALVFVAGGWCLIFARWLARGIRR
jgi:hypothetical protein